VGDIEALGDDDPVLDTVTVGVTDTLGDDVDDTEPDVETVTVGV
jgi:hypothetical protein